MVIQATSETEPQGTSGMDENSNCQDVNPLKTIRFNDRETVGAFQVVKPREITQECPDTESEGTLEEVTSKLANLVSESEDQELNKTGESMVSFRDTEPQKAKNQKGLRLFPPKNVSSSLDFVTKWIYQGKQHQKHSCMSIHSRSHP